MELENNTFDKSNQYVHSGKEPEPMGLTSRRSFLKTGSWSAIGSVLCVPFVLGKHSPAGLIPVQIDFADEQIGIPGKHPDLIILNDRPINAETPPHLLDDFTTPNDRFFVRNNGIPPEVSEIEAKNWTLSIGGEAAKQEKTFSIAELKSAFRTHTYHLTLECGGNGRSEFNPPAKGNQWRTGAVGCAAWTGVRLKDILESVGYTDQAVYVGYYGKDTHISGSDQVVISRGIPMSKALQEETLIAWAMNGEQIPQLNGYPLRLVVGGWPASCSGKWLSRLVIRDKIHDGPKMKGQSYRVPCQPVAPGIKVADKDMCIIESMPVKSLITYPRTGATIRLTQRLPIRGHAWAGDLEVDRMDYSIDFGQTWKECTLSKPINKLAWQHFSATIQFPETGYYEIWARATDRSGRAQPMVIPGWNPRGYLNNACHRIAIKVV